MSTTIIDDQDLSQVTYTGSWVKGGTSHENDGTVASSTVVGDSFSVSFNGTSIGVYGTLDSTSGGVVTSYSVDGAPAAQVTSAAASGDTYRQLFWQSDTLTAKQHNLIVKMVNVNANQGDGEGTIWFDYFQVAGVLPPTSSSTSTPSSTGSTSTSSTTTTTQSGGTAHKKKSIGPIIGGVVAALACLILAAFIIACMLRRRRRKRGDDDIFIPPKMEIDGADARISPVYMPLPQNNGSRVNIPPSAPVAPPVNNFSHQMPAGHAPSSYSPPPAGQSVLYYDNQPRSSMYAQSSHSVPPESSSASITMPSRPSVSKENPSLTLAWVPVQQHVDSGMRVANPHSDGLPADIPPVYSED